jgi:hypothetical protein
MRLHWSKILGLAFLLSTFALPSAYAADFIARHGLTSAQYQSAFNQYVSQGYQLSHVDGYATSQGMRYAAIWNRANGSKWVARHDMNAGSYQSFFDQYTSEGYKPTDISAAGMGNNSGTFAAVWGPTSGNWVARHGLTSAQYQAAFDQFTGQNYRLIDVEGYAGPGGEVLYAAIWSQHEGPAWFTSHEMKSWQYQAAFDQAVADGFTLTHVDGYWTPEGVRYAAIWAKVNVGNWVARHGMSSDEYQHEFNQHITQGMELVHVSGYWNGSREEYAAIWRN